MFKKFTLLPLLLIAAPAQAQEWVDGFYAEVYGGTTLATEATFVSGAINRIFDLDAGGLLGASVGLETGVEGLAFEFDVLRNSARRTDTERSIDAVTVMGNAQYTAALADQFGVYGGAGLGLVFMHFDDPGGDDTGNGSGFGYQAFAGLIYDVTDNVSIFGEYRYQSTFQDILMDFPNDGFTADVNYHRHAVMAGIRVSR